MFFPLPVPFTLFRWFMKNKLYSSVLLAAFIFSGCAANNRLVYRPGKADIPYANSGLSNYLNGNYEHALADYTKAIEQNPKFDNAYWYRGEIYKQQKKYDLALTEYTKAIELNPSPNYYRGRGVV